MAPAEGSENPDASPLVVFQKLFVHSNDIIDRGGKRILWSQPVVDRHHLDLRQNSQSEFPSIREPESELNPPPCRLMSTRLRFRFRHLQRSDESVRTPAMFSPRHSRINPASLGRILRRARHPCGLAVRPRVSGPGFLLGERGQPFLRLRLMVDGMGITRVMCAVPSGSKNGGVLFGWMAPTGPLTSGQV